jgi:hypothetical protein
MAIGQIGPSDAARIRMDRRRNIGTALVARAGGRSVPRARNCRSGGWIDTGLGKIA